MSRNFDLLQRIERERGKGFEVMKMPVIKDHERDVVAHAANDAEAAHTTTNGSRPTFRRSEFVATCLEGAALQEIQRLVQRTFLSTLGHQPRVVSFAGVADNVASSWITARTAEVLANQVSEDVCAVDTNLSSPLMDRNFEIENQSGLTEALERPGPIIDLPRPLRANLWALTSGSNSEGAQHLIGSAVLRSRIAELREHFRYVLIDAPPLNQGFDANVVGSLTDGLVLIIEAHVTRRVTAQKAIQQLQAAGVHILGVLLNGRQYPIPEALYRRL